MRRVRNQRRDNGSRDDADARAATQAEARADSPAPIPVLAAVIRRDDRYLVAKRPAHKRHGGLWEFPGGKLLAGESWLDAARRELREELGIEAVAAGEPIDRLRDGESAYAIAFVPVEIRGEPHALEHDELRWASLADLRSMDLAPADAAFVSGWSAGDCNRRTKA